MTQVTVVLTATGAGNYTVPTGVTQLDLVEVWGSGAGGLHITGGGSSGGGGGGAYSATPNVAVTSGQVIPYDIGAGGVAVANGVATWFVSNTTIMATGGLAYDQVSTTSGGLGGLASAGFGTTKHSGGNGGIDHTAHQGGGGGSSATKTSNGGNGSSSTGGSAPGGGLGGAVNAAGVSNVEGGGGGGGDQSSTNGVGGSPGGGGGGGSTADVSAPGGNGQIRITYTLPVISNTISGNVGHVTLSGQTGSTSASVTVDQFGPLNSDPTFQNWTSGLPANTTATAITVTKQTTNVLYGTSALQLSSTSAQTTSFLSLNASDFLYWQDLTNIVVEWSVTLNSGDFNQAGFAYSQYYDGIQTPQPVKNGTVHLYSQHPFPTVGQTYTGSQFMSLSAANSPTGPITTVFGNIYGNASFINGIGPSTKNVTVNRLVMRPATPAEVASSTGTTTPAYTMAFSGLQGAPITVSPTVTGGLGTLTFIGRTGTVSANTIALSSAPAHMTFTGLAGGALTANASITGGVGSLVFHGLQGGSLASSGTTINGGAGVLTFTGRAGSATTLANTTVTSGGPAVLTLNGFQGSLANLANTVITSSGPATLTLTTYSGSTNSPTVTVGHGTMSFTGLNGRTGIVNGGSGSSFIFYAAGNIRFVNPSITRQ